MRMILRIDLHSSCNATIRVTFAQHWIDRTTQHLGIARVDVALGVSPGLFGIVRDVEALRLQLGNRGSQLRDRGTDIWQLDDVGIRRFRQVAQFRERVALTLFIAQVFGKLARIRPAREISRVSTAIPAESVNALTIGSSE